ncbi:unnamed protein product [Acanthoscelides obtectus]|uniref:DNA replication ATP-dependent helicase/nuclease n=1 Tax=Acanthoscelides obtectus TaxID=200917 RepID=A0A9P0KYR1_ACAOB|nr:unnamed protein product [Acanthoscelides obtectus]CAK1626312.1 DNA replication ATP-dependent helicase/nuclease DNA2 [Acanthoscelides obtectus]
MQKGKQKNETKGNLKISSFFKVLPKNSLNTDVKEIQPCNSAVVLTISDDEDIIQGSPTINNRPFTMKHVKKKTTAKGEESLATLRKRKVRQSEYRVEPIPSNSKYHSETDSCPVPSISEYKPLRIESDKVIFVKTPEKLLTPEALKRYTTPEKKSFLEKIRTPTPKRLSFSDKFSSGPDTLLSKADESSRNNVKCNIMKNVTPKKANNSPQKTTPNKRTPKKLFSRSPDNLNSFNVQVIKDFVKITPSKSNQRIEVDAKILSSSEKKQSTMFRYVGTTPSEKSKQAQALNEATPTKSPVTTSEIPSTSKVKTKLDFADCTKQTLKSPVKSPTLKKNGQSSSLDNVFAEFQFEEFDSESRKNSKMSPAVTKNENELNHLKDEFQELEFDEWEGEVNTPETTSYDLDLKESQHCKIKNIEVVPKRIILKLESTKTGESAICNVEGFWVHAVLNTSDTVHVKAKKLENGEWLIDNDNGLLVFEPDMLISTTSVVNSLFCKRKSVLVESFRGFEPTNKAMLVGTIVHTLLQTALKNNLRNKRQIEKAAKELCQNSATLRDLYDADIAPDDLLNDVLSFVPKIEEFMWQYVKHSQSNGVRSLLKENWNGWIDTIDDIEENIWCTELGFKGKVDINVKSGSQLMPLELKTGRASVSLEHRGQVMMYIMMMNKLGYKVSSGLLLYLREGVLREIPMTHREQRDIVILRNELAYYLTRRPKITENKGSDDRKLIPPELPEPINHRGCYKCPYNVLCASFARYNNENIANNEALNSIIQGDLKTISEAHLDYIMKWITMVSLESQSNKNTKQLRDIYTQTPQKREQFGRCIINLRLTNVGDETNGMYDHTFMKMNSVDGVNFFANGISDRNYVVISTNTRPAVASGFVSDISSNSISVTLDRDLNKKYSGQTFHIDSYESSTAYLFSFANLTLLLELTDRSADLRRIIIDKASPTFMSTLPKQIAVKGKEILTRLNKVQQRAVLKAIAAKEYYLIMGMPGTGKTATIVALIQLLCELKKTVLITSHTHSAVDNVCIKLIRLGVKLIRLGSEARMQPELKKYSEHYLTKNCKTPEDLKAVYEGAQVIAVTCLGAGHPVLSKRTMDICIIDESTQVVQSTVIRPLYASKTFILVGDPKQLPAVVKNNEARSLGMSESLFERLYSKDACSVLNINYRMNKTITNLANEITYDGDLQIGNEMVANATLRLKKQVLEIKSQWIKRTLDTSLEKAVIFLDTGPVWNLVHDVPWLEHPKDDRSDNINCVNIYEAAITAILVKTLLQAGVENSQIGVIASYRNQVAQITTLIKSSNVTVSTVDQFQGMDKNVIIYSCTKSRNIAEPKEINKFEILEDPRRITVAVTRAKHKLILIGDINTISEYTTFKKLVTVLKEDTLCLPALKGFNWKKILDVESSS